MTCDLLIHCGWLLPMKKQKFEILEKQSIAISNGKIVWTGNTSDSQKFHAKKTMQATDSVAMPGLINMHTHHAMSLFRGLADDLPFQEWLFQNILPLEARLVSPEFVRIGAKLSAAESILRGVTTHCDMYYFQEETADVFDRAGLRAFVGEAFSNFAPPDDKQSTGENFKILERMAEKYKGHSRIQAASAPHAPYTCSDDLLTKVRDFSDRLGLKILIHVSETQTEVDGQKKEFQMSPVERMHKLGITGERSVFAHCVHLSEQDIAILAKSKTAISHNPESNMKLGSGVCPVPALIKAGARVGLGTDGAASNNDLCMIGEMQSAAKLQKLAHQDNTAMTAPTALELATWRGAEALGIGSVTGSLEVNKSADICIVNMNKPHLWPVHDISSHLVYAAQGADVESVLCEGKVLLENGKLTGFQLNELKEEILSYRKRVSF